jgi:hypothetical protein
MHNICVMTEAARNMQAAFDFVENSTNQVREKNMQPTICYTQNVLHVLLQSIVTLTVQTLSFSVCKHPLPHLHTFLSMKRTQRRLKSRGNNVRRCQGGATHSLSSFTFSFAFLSLNEQSGVPKAVHSLSHFLSFLSTNRAASQKRIHFLIHFPFSQQTERRLKSGSFTISFPFLSLNEQSGVSKAEAITSSAVKVAQTLECPCIVVLTETGSSARYVSKYVPSVPVITLTHNDRVVSIASSFFVCVCFRFASYHRFFLFFGLLSFYVSK